MGGVAVVAMMMTMVHVRAVLSLPPLDLRMVPRDVANQFGAMCLDGTMPAYYYRLAHNANQNWIVFLEGGGWCLNAAECGARAESWLGTSNQCGPTMDDPGGVMSANSSTNPAFSDFNMVFVHYCDGSSFASNNPLPVPVPTEHGVGVTQLHLRGRANFDAVISDLNTTYGMSDATSVILTGGSAGGLGVLFNLDHLSSLVSSTTRVLGFPDAAFFLDLPVFGTNSHVFRDSFISADEMWHVTAGNGTNMACLKAEVQPWNCLFAEHVSKYITVPMFLMNSAYDEWQLSNIVGLSCLNHSPTLCNGTELAAIQDFRRAFLQAITPVVSGNNGTNGAFVDSCYVHEQNVDYCSSQLLPNCLGWNKYGVKNSEGDVLTPQLAVSAWFSSPASHPNITIDQLSFPNNPSCPYSGP